MSYGGQGSRLTQSIVKRNGEDAIPLGGQLSQHSTC